MHLKPQTGDFPSRSRDIRIHFPDISRNKLIVNTLRHGESSKSMEKSVDIPSRFWESGCAVGIVADKKPILQFSASQAS